MNNNCVFFSVPDLRLFHNTNMSQPNPNVIIVGDGDFRQSKRELDLGTAGKNM
jgi:hypothetical protein